MSRTKVEIGTPQAMDTIPSEGTGIFVRPDRPGFQMVGLGHNGQLFQYKIVPDDKVKETIEELAALLESKMGSIEGSLH